MMKSAFLLLSLLLPPAAADSDLFYRSAELTPATAETYPCGLMTEKLNTEKMPKGTTVQAGEGKALLWVMVQYGGFYQNRIGVDGRWVGATKGRGHIAVELEPGEHRVCAKLRTVDPAFTKVNVEAGKTYYLRVWFVTSSAFGRIAFETLDDREAEREMKDSTLYKTTLKK